MFSLHCMLMFLYAGMQMGPIFLMLIPPNHWCQVSPLTEQHIKEVYIREHQFNHSNHTYLLNGNYSEKSHLKMDYQGSSVVFESFLKMMTVPITAEGDYANCEIYDVDFIQVSLAYNHPY